MADKATHWLNAIIDYLVDFQDTRTSERGLSYLVRGNVLQVIASPKSVEARVAGSFFSEYDTELYLEEGQLESRCSCPVGGYCKHVYAVALAILGAASQRGDISAQFAIKNFPDKFARVPHGAGTVDFTGIEKILPPPEPVDKREFKKTAQTITKGKTAKARAEKPVADEEQKPWWRRFLEAPDRPAQALIIKNEMTRLFAHRLRQFWRFDYVIRNLLELENPIQILSRFDLVVEEIARDSGQRMPVLDKSLAEFLKTEESRNLFHQHQRRMAENRLLEWLHTTETQQDVPLGHIDCVWSMMETKLGIPILGYEILLTTKKLTRSPRTYAGVSSLLRDIESGKRRFKPEEEKLLRWLLDFNNTGEPTYNYYSRTSAEAHYVQNALAWLITWGFQGMIEWKEGGKLVFDPVPARLSLAPRSENDPTPIWTVFLPASATGPARSFPLNEAHTVIDGKTLHNVMDPAEIYVRQGDVLRRLETGGMPVKIFTAVCQMPEAPVERLRSDPAGTILARRLLQGEGSAPAGALIQPVSVQPMVEFRCEDEDILSVAALAKTPDGLSFHRQPDGLWVRSGSARPGAELEEIALPRTAEETEDTKQSTEPAPVSPPAPQAISLAPRPEDVAALEDWLSRLVPPQASPSLSPARVPALSWKIRNRSVGEFLRLWPARPRGVTYLGDRAFQRLLLPRRVPDFTVKLEPSGVDFLQVSIEMEKELEAISMREVFEALESSQGELLLLPGSGVYKREDLEHYRKRIETLSQLGVEMGSGSQRLHAIQLAGSAGEALLEMGDADDRLRELAQQTRRLIKSFAGIPSAPVDAATAAFLRPYQKAGADFLAWAGPAFGGALLADDMGLGKTIQVLAALTAIRRKMKKRLPSLVVCPASVAHNWEREVHRFAPGLKTVVIESGKARVEILKRLGDYDLIIKNYALTRRDAEILREQEWLMVCVDEAQAIKNPAAEITKTVKSLKAAHRFALTGTPIENRLSDLWSIIDFISPGYLQTLEEFEARLRGEQAPFQQRLLRARLRPILLRRMKAEVAPELPPRIEERRDCAMTAGQKKAYLTEMRKTRLLLDGIDDKELKSKGRIMILAALTRLRQICCDPALINLPDTGSGKVEELRELLPPLLEAGHKVLLFSQFVKMLMRLRKTLKELDIPQYMLTGQTPPKERHAIISRFEADPQPGVFLISLKAGGSGLNLTAASHVVLFDPWWNPAVEAQAIDRTHRIGQNKTVVAFRLVTQGTIEERIAELQEQKRGLVQNILEEESFNRMLTREDFEYLLSE